MPRRRSRSRADAVTILIIDDNVDDRRIYATYLRTKGCVVTCAEDGRRGIDQAIELRPDLIVLDLAMPRVDGWTVLKHLRESSWTVDVPIVILTANATARDEAFQVGCDAYLVKPVPPEVLWLQSRSLLRARADLAARVGFWPIEPAGS